MSDDVKIPVSLPGNAKGDALAIAAALERVEEHAAATREALKGASSELRTAQREAAALAKEQEGLKDPALKEAAGAASGEAKKRVDELTKSVEAFKAEQKRAKKATEELRDGLRDANVQARRLEREGAKAVTDEIKRASKETEELKKHFGDVTSLAGRVVRGAQDAAVDAMREFVRGIPAGNAAAERHTTVLTNLRGAYAQVQAATRGVVTAEQAYAVQSRLTESGLSLNAQQLGTVTGRAREFAHTTGVDLQQALDQLTEGLNTGSNEQLRKFGIHVQQGATRTQTFQSALRQLEQQQRGNAPAAITAAEAQQQFEQSLTQATQAAQSLIAQRVGLTDFLVQATGLFRDLTDGTQSWADVLETAAGTLGEMVGLHAHGSNQGTQSTSSDFMAQYAGAQRTARALGIDVSGLPAAGPLAVRTNAQERQQILDALNGQIRARQTQSRATTAAGAAGMFGGTDLTGVQDLSQGVRGGLAGIIGDIEHEATARGAAAALDATKAEARRLAGLRQTGARDAAAQATPVDAGAVADARAELARLQNGVMRAGGTVGGEVPGARYLDTSPDARLDELQKRAEETGRRAHENELAFLQRRQAATQAYLQALREQEAVTDRVRAKDREADGVEAQRRANALNATEERRTHEEESLRMRIETVGVTRSQLDAETALGEAQRHGTNDTRARAEGLTELRTALEGLLAETNAHLEQARAEGRSQAEINRLLQERIGLQSSLTQVTREQTQLQEQQHAATNAWKDAMVGAAGQATDAFAASSIAAWQSGKSWSDAMEEMLRASLAALAKQAIVETIKGTAIGFIALAQGNVPAATSAFTGAALWAATGLAAGGTLAAIGPASKPAAAAATAPAAPPRAAQLGASDRGAQQSGGLTLNITVSGALFNEGVEDSVVRAVDRAHARGVIPRFARQLSP